MGTAYTLVHNYSSEFCGNIAESGGKSYFLNTTAGAKDESGRAMCSHPHAQINYHTHPETSKAYPSSEDIVKMITYKAGAVNSSIEVIFTKWGIWQITSLKRIISSSKDRTAMKVSLDKEVLHLFYAQSDGGRALVPPPAEVRALMQNIEWYAWVKGANIKVEFRGWGAI